MLRRELVRRLRAFGSRGLPLAGLTVLVWLAVGCPFTDTTTQLPLYNNQTDPTNAGAVYIGSVVCRACHSDKAELTRLHGHTYALNHIDRAAPQYPAEGTRAGVPNPPTGKTWTDIAYVISGYLHCAFFIDTDGYVLTDGVEGVNTKWLLDFPANGTTAGFVAFKPSQETPLPYDYETCFRCHTTGPEPQGPANPQSQDGRVGILGTWAEAGVQCEACHGPGSNHAPNTEARDLFVDPTPATCARCHLQGANPDIIAAEGGFINGNTQYAELRASGGHSDFSCMVCHDPHASMTYDREHALRNDCTVCHTDQNMALHEGLTYAFGMATEPLTCRSCHMPLAGKNSTKAAPELVGADARIGDVRSHIFRIDPSRVNYADMFTSGGVAVLKDGQGRAALSVGFVCLRCHNQKESGWPFPLTLSSAAGIARNIHQNAAGAE